MNYVVGFIDKLGVLGRTAIVSNSEDIQSALWILYDSNEDLLDEEDHWWEMNCTQATHYGTYFVGLLETLEQLDVEEIFE